MIVDRTILNCKWGHGDEVVAIFKEVFAPMQTASEGVKGGRVLTDLSGKFFRVIVETELENLAAWEKWRAEMFQAPEFAETFAKTADLVESGSVEFFTIEAEF
ncbi:MAG: hypothetical protein ACT4OM_06715 [Actinomycetota bacterium]